MEKGKRTLKAWWPYCTLAACLAATTACRSAQEGTANAQEAQAAAVQPPAFKPVHTTPSAHKVSSPIVYIYKTRKDYSRLVPVLMDETRTRIVSYPAPTDLKTNGKLAYPTPLENGYWLDNRGISPHAAFLSYTYEEYSQMKEPPAMDDLLSHIADKDPFTYIQACGRRADYKDIVKELNEYIRERGLK